MYLKFCHDYRKWAVVLSLVLIYPSTNPIGMAIVLFLSHTYDANTDNFVSKNAIKWEDPENN